MNRSLVSEWQQLSTLYDQADVLDAAEREAWLEQLRAQDHPLLAQLLQMLRARVRVQEIGFLDTLPKLQPLAPVTPSSAADDSHVGPYLLLSRLGRGGMSEVWLAERDDGAFERQVAIKLLYCHAGFGQHDSFARRFDRERDILASLHHPNIASLHDAGVTPTGQPWIALEYVEGQTLTRWCDTERRGVRARAELFLQVLRAVQHAHAKLVIHRDLKPGNILVTRQGEVRLLDFGIAKFLEPDGHPLVDSELTRQAGRPLTLQYASPEQIRGQPLSTSCDVYSLGVVLYELLCGELPYDFDKGSAAQLEHAILHVEPRGPSARVPSQAAIDARSVSRPALRSMLSGDLDAVVLKALAKNPADRYSSVEALSIDLNRWLSGQAVYARAPSSLYRLGKFVRRHKWTVSAGFGAVASLLAVAIVAILLGKQARQESARALAARDFMLHIFQRANQERARGADITARELLESGRRDVSLRLHGQPQLQAEVLRGIANVQSDMGDYVNADTTFAELVRVEATALEQPRDEAMARADYADNALQMNNADWAHRRLEDAKAVASRPLRDPELNARLAEVAGRIAMSYGDIRQAREIFASARQIAVRELGDDNIRTFRLGQSLLAAQREMNEFNAAQSLYIDLKHTSIHVSELKPSETAVMNSEHVHLLLAAGKISDAMAEIQIMLPDCIETLGSLEQSCRFLFLSKMQILLRMRLFDRAEGMLKALDSIGSDDSSPYLRVEALLLRLRFESFISQKNNLTLLFERVRGFGQSDDVVPIKSTFKAAALLTLAEAKLRVCQPTQAKYWVSLALDRLGTTESGGGNQRLAAVGRMLLGVALLQEGRSKEALEALDRAQVGLKEAYGSDHPLVALFSLNNALALEQLGRTSDALRIVMKAEPILSASLGMDTPINRAVAELKSRMSNRDASDQGPTSMHKFPMNSSPQKRSVGAEFYS